MQLVFLLALFCTAHTLQLLLTQSHTCLGLEVNKDGEKYLFNYHHNPNIATANMLIYGSKGQLLGQSGIGAEYKSFFEVKFDQKGEIKMCFEKNDTPNLEIHFDIVHEQQQLQHAGREDLGRMTRRIGEFLVEIKKTSLEYKQVLTQHNHRQEQIAQFEKTNLILYAIKLLVMGIILFAQAWAVRKIFN